MRIEKKYLKYKTLNVALAQYVMILDHFYSKNRKLFTLFSSKKISDSFTYFYFIHAYCDDTQILNN